MKEERFLNTKTLFSDIKYCIDNFGFDRMNSNDWIFFLSIVIPFLASLCFLIYTIIKRKDSKQFSNALTLFLFCCTGIANICISIIAFIGGIMYLMITTYEYVVNKVTYNFKNRVEERKKEEENRLRWERDKVEYEKREKERKRVLKEDIRHMEEHNEYLRKIGEKPIDIPSQLYYDCYGRIDRKFENNSI